MKFFLSLFPPEIVTRFLEKTCLFDVEKIKIKSSEKFSSFDVMSRKSYKKCTSFISRKIEKNAPLFFYLEDHDGNLELVEGQLFGSGDDAAIIAGQKDPSARGVLDLG